MIYTTFYQDRYITIVICMTSFQYPSICITHCMGDIIKSNERKIFSTDAFADQIKWNKNTRSPWCEENIRYKSIPLKKQKVILQIKKTILSKPRLGQGRAGIMHRKPQLIENITASTNELHEIRKIPATQHVAKIE